MCVRGTRPVGSRGHASAIAILAPPEFVVAQIVNQLVASDCRAMENDSIVPFCSVDERQNSILNLKMSRNISHWACESPGQNAGFCGTYNLIVVGISHFMSPCTMRLCRVTALDLCVSY